MSIRNHVLLSILMLAGSVVACGDSNNNSNTNKPDAPKPDAPRAIDAPLPDAPPAPTGLVAIPLTSLDELSYTGPVTVGGQPFAMIMDTGSTTLGVAGSACASCGVSPTYTPGESAIDEHAEGSSTYADGTGWDGEIFRDFAQLGSAADVDMALVDISTSNNFFRSFTGAGGAQYQGILGLGPTVNAIQGTDGYIDQAFAAGEPSQFAFQMCDASGTMWVGGVDGSAEASPEAQTAMIGLAAGFYGVSTSAMAVGSGSAFGSASDFGLATIIDTGTSIAFIPTGPLATLTDQIQSSEGFATVFAGSQDLGSNEGCPISTMTADQIDAALPPLHVAFPDANGSNTPFVDLPATHSYLVASGQNQWCFGFFDSADLTGGQGPAISLFGDSLLDAWVVDFNVGTATMGFALESGCAGANNAHVHGDVATPPRVPGIPWWKQDPRVRVPDRNDIQRKIAAFREHHR